MNMDLFSSLEIRECDYKDEHYSAREDGAVMRHCRVGKPKRRLDNVWTRGTPGAGGYLCIAGERVNRIVATAFHGLPPDEQYVADHIDTNCQNNRPDNLRWVTKQDNLLENEITRKKIELVCGSIEAFKENPSLLYGKEKKTNSWMRSVTQEEAKNSLENWTLWARTALPNPNYKECEHQIGEWIYDKPIAKSSRTPSFSFTGHVRNKTEIPIKEAYESNIMDTEEWLAKTFGNKENKIDVPSNGDWDTIEGSDSLEYTETDYISDSLTPLAKQKNWRTPSEFPCCPQQFSGNPLEVYMNGLEEGKLFCTNKYGDSHVLQFGMTQDSCLWVMCRVHIGPNTHAFTKITFEDGFFCHENVGAFDIGDEPEKLFKSILSGEIEI